MSLLKRLSAALCAAAIVLTAGVVEAQTGCWRARNATSQVDTSALPAITTAEALPDATEGVGYSLQFVASGGTGGYRWDNYCSPLPCPYGVDCNPSWCHLPPGLSISEGGLLQGTPTASGNFIVWVMVHDSEGDSGRLFALHINPSAGYVFSTWVPVASHVGGLNGSEWHTDIGVLNPGASAANVEVLFYGASGVASMSASVQPGVQSTLVDAVRQLGASGSGAIEVLSDQPVKVTSRTYNQVASNASCDAGGSQGQDYPAVVWSNGLLLGDIGYLAGLTENASHRCNIGLVNTGTENTTVVVELFDGNGSKLTDYTVTLNPGDWKQETQPFLNKAGQTAMDRGYAKVGIQQWWWTGSGVFAFASVIDNVTNDPTTVTMQR